MKEIEKFNSLLELTDYFKTEELCLQHLEEHRWGSMPICCPICGNDKTYTFKTNKFMHKCAACRMKFTVKTGSVFEESRLPLRKWFMAIYLLTSHKKGISSLQLGKAIHVTQKTAWFMLGRLRNISTTKAFQAPVKNKVELDETYVSGKEKNKHYAKKTKGTQGRSLKTKTPVCGMVERGGTIKAMVIPDTTQQMISSQVIDHIMFGTELLTDELQAYRSLVFAYAHEFVEHGAGQYVQGHMHTNTLEGFFSLLKRSILGIYHSVSAKHLDFYVRECTFRYNIRVYT